MIWCEEIGYAYSECSSFSLISEQHFYQQEAQLPHGYRVTRYVSKFVLRFTRYGANMTFNSIGNGAIQ